MGGAVKIRFDVEVPDLVAFAQYHARHTPAVRRIRLTVLAVGLAPLIVVPPLVVPSAYQWLALAAGVVVAVLVAVQMPGAFDRSVKRQVRRQYRNGAFQDAFGAWELELTATHLVKRTSAIESSTRLTALGRVIVTHDYAFIYASPMTGFIIPRHAVVGGDFDQFAAAVAQGVADARPEFRRI
jgi:hypothetical protein